MIGRVRGWPAAGSVRPVGPVRPGLQPGADVPLGSRHRLRRLAACVRLPAGGDDTDGGCHPAGDSVMAQAMANRTASRRAKREARTGRPTATSLLDQMTGREAFAALDEELGRLPPRYREPLVLCCLEGLARDEAAARLGIPPNTLKSQLERGRKKLGDALT